MKSLIGFHEHASPALLTRILERPALVAAVRELPGAVLGRLIDRIGLEDAGPLVALASTAQLERIFDDDLWSADGTGGDERFRPERFALWLRVMQEAGEAALVQRLCELPEDLLALAVHRLVLVLDLDVIDEELRPADDEAEQVERALENAVFEEWEEFRVIAREPDAWDEVWSALLALDRDHHDRLRALLERCRDMTTEYISGQGGLFQVLTADEMLDSDLAAEREDRRSAEGFVSPADARAFLEIARRGGATDQRDPITRAYFRALANPPGPPGAAPPPADASQVSAIHGRNRALETLLMEAEVMAPAPAPRALEEGARHSNDEQANSDQTRWAAPLFEQALTDLRQADPVLFSTRARELGYLVNVWMAGGGHQGRRARPPEALELVLKTCEAGMRADVGRGVGAAARGRAAAALAQTPADILFRRGFSIAK